MHTLYICRHAKSDRGPGYANDHDRPLNERGLRNAPYMAGLFAQRGEPVDLLLSSTAARAAATADFHAAALGVPAASILHRHELYLASVQDIVHVLNGLTDDRQRVMLFGHNPGLSQLLEYLADDGIGDLPTGSIVRVDLHVSAWASVGRGTGTIVWWDHPKRHPGQE
ncbi:MAG: histidine phosphatase family protein [Flavobacteriales bacterium]